MRLVYATKKLALLVLLPTFAGQVAFFACSSGIRNIDDINTPTDDVSLAKCRSEGRAARAADATPEAAYGVYDSCVKDAGLR